MQVKLYNAEIKKDQGWENRKFFDFDFSKFFRFRFFRLSISIFFILNFKVGKITFVAMPIFVIMIHNINRCVQNLNQTYAKCKQKRSRNLLYYDKKLYFT